MSSAAVIRLELQSELVGHKSDVNCCSWSPEDQTLCSCGGDKTLRLWNIHEKKEISPSPISAHQFYVNYCAYSPSGDLLASGSSDTTIKLWSTASWDVLDKLSGHSGAVRGLAFSPDGCLLASGSDDKVVRVWDVGSHQCIATLEKHTESVTTCCFAPMGWLLVTGSSSGDIILFDCFKKTTVARILRADELGVNTVQVSPKCEATDSAFSFVCAGGDGVIKLWTVTLTPAGKKSLSVAKAADLTGHNAGIFTLCYSRDGRYLASGDADKYVIIWDLETLTSVTRLKPHTRYVTHVSFSPDGSYFATCSNDKSIKVWRVRHGPPTVPSAPPPLELVKLVSEEKAVTPSALSAEEWSVDRVCRWLDSVSAVQNSGNSAHPDDLRAAQRIARSLEAISLYPGKENLSVGDFHCPITQETMRDPVVAADGFTYERSAITNWFSQGRRSSPSTNLPLPNTLLVPNKHLRTLIDKTKTTTGQ
jgi:WD40 repeat protein